MCNRRFDDGCQIAEKRKRAKKDGKDGRVDEDEPAAYKHAVYVMTMKLFADLERRRRDLEIRDTEERKRKREQEIEEEEKAALQKEWQKNFEVRNNMVCFCFFFILALWW